MAPMMEISSICLHSTVSPCNLPLQTCFQFVSFFHFDLIAYLYFKFMPIYANISILHISFYSFYFGKQALFLYLLCSSVMT